MFFGEERGVFENTPPLFEKLPDGFKKVSGCFIGGIAMFFQKDGEVFDFAHHFFSTKMPIFVNEKRAFLVVFDYISAPEFNI